MSWTPKQREFMRLFGEIEPELLRFLVVMVANEADATDILQETSVVLWQKFDEYDDRLPFGPWARKFAYLQANKFLLKQAREGKYLAAFAGEVSRQISHEYDQHVGVLELRLSALETCVGKVSPEDRELLNARYGTEGTLRALADRRNVAESRLYRRLKTVRKSLQVCIRQTLAAEGS